MKKVVTFTLLLILAFSVISVEAIFSEKLDEDDLKISVEIGYNSNNPIEGKWMPVDITIENKTNDNIEGNLVFSFEDGKSERISTSVVLPGNVTKKTTIYVFYTGQARYRVILENKKGKTLYQTERDSISISHSGYGTINHIGIMTDNQDSLNYLRRMEHVRLEDYTAMIGGTFVNSAVRVDILDSNNFPVSKLAISSFDALFLNDFDLSSLTSEQKSIFDYYLKTGGTVIFGTGNSSTYAFAGMNEFVGHDVGDVTEKNVLLRLIKHSTSEAKPDALSLKVIELRDKNLEVARVENSTPIVYKHKNYNLYYFTFALNDPAFTNWAFNYEYMFEFLFDHTNALKAIDEGQIHSASGNKFTNILGYASENFLPSMILIVLLIVGYMLIVGPIAYAILKKKDKREYMWAVIPVVVIVFSVAIFMYGYISRGGGNIASSVTIVELNPYSELQKPAYLATSVMTSSNGDYSLTYGNDATFGVSLLDFFSNRFDYYNEQSTATVFKQGNKSSAQIKGATMWSLFGTEAMVDVKNYGSIETDFHVDENGFIIAKLKNNTGYDLENIVVTVHDKVHGIPSLKYLDTVEVKITRGRTMQNNYIQRIRSQVLSLFNSNQGGYYGRYYQPNPGELIREIGKEDGVKASLLIKLLSSKMGANEFSTVPQMHIAGCIVKGEDVNVKINGRKPSREYNHTIVYQSVSLQGFSNKDFEESYLPEFLYDYSVFSDDVNGIIVLSGDHEYALYEVAVPKSLLDENSLEITVNTVSNKEVILKSHDINTGVDQYIGQGSNVFSVDMAKLSSRDYSVATGYAHDPNIQYAYFIFRIEAVDKTQKLGIESVEYEFSPYKK